MTIEHAENITYRPYLLIEGHCCAAVPYPGRHSQWHHQCRRAATYGPGKLYCLVHDPRRLKKRDKERQEAKRRQLIEMRRREKAKGRLCVGVPTDAIEALGNGWLARHIAECKEGE